MFSTRTVPVTGFLCLAFLMLLGCGGGDGPKQKDVKGFLSFAMAELPWKIEKLELASYPSGPGVYDVKAIVIPLFFYLKR
jgi:hypothetical protein